MLFSGEGLLSICQRSSVAFHSLFGAVAHELYPFHLNVLFCVLIVQVALIYLGIYTHTHVNIVTSEEKRSGIVKKGSKAWRKHCGGERGKGRWCNHIIILKATTLWQSWHWSCHWEAIVRFLISLKDSYSSNMGNRMSLLLLPNCSNNTVYTVHTIVQKKRSRGNGGGTFSRKLHSCFCSVECFLITGFCQCCRTNGNL